MLRVLTANLNGIRSAELKGFFDWLDSASVDIACVQEVRAPRAEISARARNPGGMNGFFHHADRPGYSGVGIYTRSAPTAVVEGLGVPEIDCEGRYLQLDFPDLSVASVYLPSGSSSPERLQAKFRFLDVFLPHLATLRASGREVILCGDWNIAHREIDIRNWRGNLDYPGFLPRERAWLSQVLGEAGFADAFRRVESGADRYTWWSNRGGARERNIGWRIDYQIATPRTAARAFRASVYTEKWFSDHAPLLIDYED